MTTPRATDSTADQSPETESPAGESSAGRGWPVPDPVVADGRRIALYRPVGQRDAPASDVPILFVHGLHETAAAWSLLTREMPRGQQMLAPDLPGFGGSESGGAYDVSSIGELLAALALDVVDGPVDVVGRGWGASLAIGFAAIRPELVRRLTVISGPWPPSLAAGPLDPAPGFTQRLRLMAGPGLSPASKVRRGYLLPAEIAGVPRPERSLILWGAQDRLLPPRYGEKVISALGRCVDPATVEMITLPGLGAALHRTAPALVAASLCEFVRAS